MKYVAQLLQGTAVPTAGPLSAKLSAVDCSSRQVPTFEWHVRYWAPYGLGTP